MFFFFKQKTAYEMRISDWSSDVCSSDLDRMEVIRLSGYITEEKVAIAKRHLWPKQLAKAGVSKGSLNITDSALKALIDGYAREAGVRQRSEERRVGEECVSTCRSGCAQVHYKNKKTIR